MKELLYRSLQVSSLLLILTKYDKSVRWCKGVIDDDDDGDDAHERAAQRGAGL